MTEDIIGGACAESLVCDGTTVAVVIGRGEHFDLYYLGQGRGPLSAAELKRIEMRRFERCGFVGIARGKLSAVCGDKPQHAITMLHAALHFAQTHADELALCNLHALPAEGTD